MHNHGFDCRNWSLGAISPWKQNISYWFKVLLAEPDTEAESLLTQVGKAFPLIYNNLKASNEVKQTLESQQSDIDVRLAEVDQLKIELQTKIASLAEGKQAEKNTEKEKISKVVSSVVWFIINIF